MWLQQPGVAFGMRWYAFGMCSSFLLYFTVQLFACSSQMLNLMCKIYQTITTSINTTANIFLPSIHTNILIFSNTVWSTCWRYRVFCSNAPCFQLDLSCANLKRSRNNITSDVRSFQYDLCSSQPERQRCPPAWFADRDLQQADCKADYGTLHRVWSWARPGQLPSDDLLADDPPKICL